MLLAIFYFATKKQEVLNKALLLEKPPEKKGMMNCKRSIAGRP
jgi:hypothetical protein